MSDLRGKFVYIELRYPCESNDPIFSCVLCGATVQMMDRQTHADWHHMLATIQDRVSVRGTQQEETT